MRKLMRYLLMGALALGSLAGTAHAGNTYYVRTDGGTSTQCTGQADAAYDGAGTGEACAFKNPLWATGVVANGSSQGAPRIMQGGDTLIIKNGSYPMGNHADVPTTSCTTSYPSSLCYMRPIPDGTEADPTEIYGEGYATGCRAKPELWATRGANMVLNLNGVDWAVVDCLEITDHEDCSYKHQNSTHTCPGTGTEGYEGVRGQTMTNITLNNLDVHGMPSYGYHIAGFTNLTIDGGRIYANGFGGFNTAISNNSADYNGGTNYFRDLEIAFNGCTEDYPTTTIIACWGEEGNHQTGTTTGYGDGIGLGTTPGSFVIEDSWVHHNTQDGIDFLYLTENGGSLIVRRNWVEGNSGNQVKASGDDLLIENNIVIGNCDYFGYPTTRYSPYMTGGEICRAAGNTLTISPFPEAGVNAIVRFNTITGNGDNLINVSTRFGSSYTGATSTSIVRVENNVLVGQTEYANSSTYPGLYYNQGDVLATVQFYKNHVYRVADTSSTDTNCPPTTTCSDPGLRNIGMRTFDPRPTSTSSVLNTGTTCDDGLCVLPTEDYRGNARDGTPARGALEYEP